MLKSNEKLWVCNTFATFHFLKSVKTAQNQGFSVAQEIVSYLRTRRIYKALECLHSRGFFICGLFIGMQEWPRKSAGFSRLFLRSQITFTGWSRWKGRSDCNRECSTIIDILLRTDFCVRSRIESSRIGCSCFV